MKGYIPTKLDVDFPAWVLEMPFLPERLEPVLDEFPPSSYPGWQTFHGDKERGKQQGGPQCWGPATTQLILDLMSPRSCQYISKLFNCNVLIPDVVGGGMHQSGPGAHLNVHVDFDRHPDTGWRRKINLLLYLNHGWQPEWGGCLELGGLTITPEFGRMVIFETSDRSWHGHPVPVAEGHVRRSIAVYFYDPSETPAGAPHSTLWKDDEWLTPSTSSP